MDNEKLTYYEKKYERNPVEDTLKSISNKWTLHILRDLFLGKKHFNEFQTNRKTLDNKSLTRCLKNMENNGLIKRTKKNNEIIYNLTEKGHSLNKVFYELVLFAINNDENNKYYNNHEKKELKELYLEILDLK